MAGTALITGATGLLGRAVLDSWDVAALEPVALDRAVDDLLAPGGATAALSRARPSVVIHLAWVASGTPGYRSSSDNERWLGASLELANACRRSGILLLATGTPLDRVTGSASDAYASAKSALWRALSPDVGSDRMGWLRPFYVIDPVRRRPALVAQALAAREDGRPMNLLTPDSEHDFIHLADVARAIVMAAGQQLTGEVEIGAGRLRTVRELVEALDVTWQAGAPPPHTPHAHAAADTRRLLDLGWSPTATEELFTGD